MLVRYSDVVLDGYGSSVGHLLVQKHDLEGSDPSNKKVKDVVFDPTLNEAVAIGEGVEEVQVRMKRE